MATEGRTRLTQRLFEPVDIASLAAFRILFGALMTAAVVRFAAKGWIHDLYVAPEVHFTYPGFGWVQAWPEWGMALHFAAMGVAALCIALGLFTRAACAVFFVLFTYVELIDQATYLNHYYLVSILALLLAFMPSGDALSLDARRRPERRRTVAPRWCVWTLRAQLGLVYVFAGVAKLNADWLVDAQPLTLWLAARSDMPLIGPVLAQPATAYVFSWAGALFDLTIPLWLSLPKARPFAYAAVVGFHVLTWILFNIGMFPWVMIAATPIFFAPSWPRRLLPERWLGPPEGQPSALTAGWRRGGLTLLALHFAIQLALPLRHHLYPGNHLWTEDGFRFAWHVMIIEKTGAVWFQVQDPATGRHWEVTPSERLTTLQAKMMSTQPDMIAQYARMIRDEFAARGVPGVRVTADAWVAFNGRPSRRFIDPEVDLTRVSDALGQPRTWVLPLR